MEACSFVGTGNVLRIQSMLHHCDEHVNAPKKDDKDGKDEPKRDDSFQAFAVIAIALIAMGEDIGAEMSLRQFNHLVSVVVFMSQLDAESFNLADALW